MHVDADQMGPFPPIPETTTEETEIEIPRLVYILKEANHNDFLLNDFERSIIFDRTQAYRTYGVKINITEKQRLILETIAEKLCLTPATTPIKETPE